MADVFISYRHVSPDQDLAAELAKYLGDHDVSCFVDTKISIAQEWVKVIDREFRACKARWWFCFPPSPFAATPCAMK